MGILKYFIIVFFFLVHIAYSASIMQINSGMAMRTDKLSGQSSGLNALSHTVVQGQNATSQSFHVSSVGGVSTTLSYYIYSNVSWLSCDPTSGEALTTDEPALITVNYSTAKLKAGNYKSRIYVRSNGGWAFIDVFLTVTN